MTINYVIMVGVVGGFAANNPHHLRTLRVSCHFDAARAARNLKNLTGHQ